MVGSLFPKKWKESKLLGKLPEIFRNVHLSNKYPSEHSHALITLIYLWQRLMARRDIQMRNFSKVEHLPNTLRG